MSEKTFHNRLIADPARETMHVNDFRNPFAVGTIRNPEKDNGWVAPPYHMLDLVERTIALSMGERLSQALVSIYKRDIARGAVEIPGTQIIAMDICTVHLQRPLNLRAWEQAGAAEAISAYIDLAAHLHRPSYRIVPPDHRFAFADDSASPRWSPRAKALDL